jgi:hypothetical protein
LTLHLLVFFPGMEPSSQRLHKVPESKACGRTSGSTLAEPLAFEGPAVKLAAPLLFGCLEKMS